VAAQAQEAHRVATTRAEAIPVEVVTPVEAAIQAAEVILGALVEDPTEDVVRAVETRKTTLSWKT
jgi:hypothetical protein